MTGRAGPAVLALTMGEPAGIGGEIALKAWRQRASGMPPFCLIDDPLRLEALAETEGIDTPIRPVATLAEAAGVFAGALPVLSEPLAVAVTPGRPDAANAPAVLRAIERAARLAESGEALAIVTNPIHKGALYAAGFRHPGHTEYLAHLAGVAEPVMMLVVPGLRAVPVTVHAPLAAALKALTRAGIVHHGRISTRMPARAARSGARRSRSSPRRWPSCAPRASTRLAPPRPIVCFIPARGRVTTPSCACITTRR
jgi:4-hydroxythreonine-4-phosphate dehydrogenase